MKKWIALVSGLILFFSFQNCSQQSQPEKSEAANKESFRKSSVDVFESISLYDQANQQWYDINLDTGETKILTENGQDTGNRLCPNLTHVQSLQAILQNAQVCEPVQPNLTDTMCTMIYMYPYAVLKNSTSEVKLGEKQNGCFLATDLCDSQATALQGWTTQMLSALPSETCSN